MIKVVNLPPRSNALPFFEYGNVTGWGLTNDTNKPIDSQLKVRNMAVAYRWPPFGPWKLEAVFVDHARYRRCAERRAPATPAMAENLNKSDTKTSRTQTKANNPQYQA